MTVSHFLEVLPLRHKPSCWNTHELRNTYAKCHLQIFRHHEYNYQNINWVSGEPFGYSQFITFLSTPLGTPVIPRHNLHLSLFFRSVELGHTCLLHRVTWVHDEIKGRGIHKPQMTEDVSSVEFVICHMTQNACQIGLASCLSIGCCKLILHWWLHWCGVSEDVQFKLNSVKPCSSVG